MKRLTKSEQLRGPFWSLEPWQRASGTEQALLCCSHPPSSLLRSWPSPESPYRLRRVSKGICRPPVQAVSVARFAHFQLISFHFRVLGVMASAAVLASFAIAMGVDALTAVAIGKWYDRAGKGVLLTVPLGTATDSMRTAHLIARHDYRRAGEPMPPGAGSSWCHLARTNPLVV